MYRSSDSNEYENLAELLKRLVEMPEEYSRTQDGIKEYAKLMYDDATDPDKTSEERKSCREKLKKLVNFERKHGEKYGIDLSEVKKLIRSNPEMEPRQKNAPFREGGLVALLKGLVEMPEEYSRTQDGIKEYAKLMYDDATDPDKTDNERNICKEKLKKLVNFEKKHGKEYQVDLSEVKKLIRSNPEMNARQKNAPFRGGGPNEYDPPYYSKPEPRATVRQVTKDDLENMRKEHPTNGRVSGAFVDNFTRDQREFFKCTGYRDMDELLNASKVDGQPSAKKARQLICDNLIKDMPHTGSGKTHYRSYYMKHIQPSRDCWKKRIKPMLAKAFKKSEKFFEMQSMLWKVDHENRVDLNRSTGMMR